jgi:hypothetical protein
MNQPDREAFLNYAEHVRVLIAYANPAEHVIVTGRNWAWSDSAGRDPHFAAPNFSHPLDGVVRFPLRLAQRCLDFTGGSIVPVKTYLEKTLESIQQVLQ